MQKTLQQLETRLIILQVINKKMEKLEVETSGFFCASARNVDRMRMLRKKKKEMSPLRGQMSHNVLKSL